MDKILNYLKDIAKGAHYWSFFLLEKEEEEVSVRQGVTEPISLDHDKGAMITVVKNGCMAYGATQDLSQNGIKTALEKALLCAEKYSEYSLLRGIELPFKKEIGQYESPKETPLLNISLEEKLHILQEAEKILRNGQNIVDSEASLWGISSTSYFYNSLGSSIEQKIYKVIPSLSATAYQNGVSQTRTLGGMRAYCQQGGFENILKINLPHLAEGIVKDVVDLVAAPNCPSQVMDLVIDPDQMMLQIHESIGHPLELDRILGDERNYAGTSFVSLDMFGNYQYGSKLLNITFDPSINEQFASYGYDDEGTKAHKEFLIKDGLLVKPLGGALSQQRANMQGTANARSCSWNRPPIDRMANLNLEPGNKSLEEIISSIKRGLYVKSNSSWSIDDSRNKFQFGCEWGRLIEDGKLTKIVRNPNYRGISANFWQNLSLVGDRSTFQVMGTPFCGKGEPNQCIQVGHASPVCKFTNIDVFGGE